MGIMPFVSAASSGAFDLWYLLVENVFGNLMLTGIGLVVIMIIIGVLSRMSTLTIEVVVGMFIVTFAVGYVGAIASVFVSIGTITYFSIAVIRFFNQFRN